MLGYKKRIWKKPQSLILIQANPYFFLKKIMHSLRTSLRTFFKKKIGIFFENSAIPEQELFGDGLLAGAGADFSNDSGSRLRILDLFYVPLWTGLRSHHILMALGPAPEPLKPVAHAPAPTAPRLRLRSDLKKVHILICDQNLKN